MQSRVADPQLMLISREAIPGALAKAERYRFLNQPWQAESICRDVLSIESNNEVALILLILCLTDQFDKGISAGEAMRIVERLPDEYQRTYYSGIIHERQAIAMFGQDCGYRSRRRGYTLFQNAMELYRQAQATRPSDNDDSVLRWNACVRFLERNWGLQ
jgi:hypothetical protein